MASVNSGKGDKFWPAGTKYWEDNSMAARKLRDEVIGNASQEAIDFLGDVIFDYEPILEGDGSKLTEEEQQQRRLTHIGGSEVADIFGQGRFKSNLELYYEKIGASQRIQDEDAFKQNIFAWGHALEPVAADAFASMHPDWDIRADETIFNHSKWPFLSANVDRIAKMPDGSWRLIEIKCPTSVFSKAPVWGTDDDPLLPAEYELQVRFYMAVLGLWKATVVVMFGPNDIITRDVTRDLDDEMALLRGAVEFWERNVLPRIAPDVELTPRNASRALDAFRTFGPAIDKGKVMNFDDPAIEDACRQYLALDDECKRASAIQDALKEKRKALIANLLIEMGNEGCGIGIVKCEDGGTITVKCIPQAPRASTDLKKLEMEYPKAFADCVSFGTEGPRIPRVKYSPPGKKKK